jgi:putative ABC transport system permease protein
MLDTVRQDLRYTLRSFRMNPGFALIAITALALGTGANTALFQLLDAVRLRSLPVRQPQNLVELRIPDMTHARGDWLRDAALTNPLWERIRDNQTALSSTLAWADESLEVSLNGESHQINGLWVSGDFFNVLGVKPMRGRVFAAADDKRGCGFAPGAVVSYGFWQRKFGGDPAVLGKTTTIGGNRIKIIGVTLPSFYGLEVGRTFDIAMPICSEAALEGSNERLDSGITWWLTVMGRLKPGASLDQSGAILRNESSSIFRATLPPGYPADSVKPYLAMRLRPTLAGYGLSHLRERYSRPLILLLLITGLVLLIACGNLANLMLARGTARRRELAVRIAIGASKLHLGRQVGMEGLLLAITGCTGGLLLAQILTRFLVSFLGSGDAAIFIDLRPNLHAFVFTMGAGVLTCAVFVAAPVLKATQTDPGMALGSGLLRMTAGHQRVALRRMLVACQIAVSIVLLVGTLLFVRTLRNLQTLDPGFTPHGVSIVDIDFSGFNPTRSRSVSFRRELVDRLLSIPGVDTVSEATIIPLTGADWNNRVWRDGSDVQHARVSMRSMIGAGYMRTLKTPVLAGRDLDQRDIEAASKVALINERFAREVFGKVNPVGKHFWIEVTPYEPQTAYEIVGLVKNSKYHDLREEFQPIMFLPMSQAALQRSSERVMIRSIQDPGSLASTLRNTLLRLNPNLRYSFHSFDSRIEESLVRERLMATLSSLFGVLAVVLTMAGLYGVISYTVALRTREIGIRVALGANRAAILKLIAGEAAAVLGVGLTGGCLLALIGARVTSTLLFGLQSNDPQTLAAATIALALTTLLATYLPARRAARLNPLNALRQE